MLILSKAALVRKQENTRKLKLFFPLLQCKMQGFMHNYKKDHQQAGKRVWVCSFPLLISIPDCGKKYWELDNREQPWPGAVIISVQCVCIVDELLRIKSKIQVITCPCCRPSVI